MKRNKLILLLVLLAFFCECFSLVSYADNQEYAWYCKRSGNLQPDISKEEKMISKYNAFSIDRSVTNDSDKKVIYLTFDAGYENGNVEKILKTLKNENISAAFFVLDNIILKNTDLVKKMALDGHLVCNHTRNHKNICSLSAEEITSNLNSLELIYKEQTGREMAKYFRFPEGKYSEEALKIVSDLGYKTVFWSFAYEDWDNSHQMNKEKAKKKILANTHNGAVMLFHPTSSVNAELFPELIKEWKRMGYSFGTLEDLCSNNTKV